jgi:hypothetical protein
MSISAKTPQNKKQRDGGSPHWFWVQKGDFVQLRAVLAKDFWEQQSDAH